MSQTSTLLQSLSRQWSRVLQMLPDIVLALALLVLGWLLAKLARRVVTRILRSLKVDEIAERSGFDDFLIQGGVKFTTVTLIASGVYWALLFGVFVALLDALGVQAAGDLFERMVNYLPNVMLAVGILVFGSLFSRVIGGLVYSYLSNIGSVAAEPIGALARYALLVFVLFMAAEQLTIGSEVLVSAFQIAFAAICFAAALAFGLGGKDWAARVIERYSKK